MIVACDFEDIPERNDAVRPTSGHLDPDQILAEIVEQCDKRNRERSSQVGAGEKGSHSDRIKAGLEERAKRGKPPTRVPYGYRNETETRAVSIHPTKGPIVRALFELYTTGKFSAWDLAEMFSKAANGRRVQESPFSERYVLLILANPIYGGRFFFQGRLCRGSYDPIVPWSEFMFVQLMLAIMDEIPINQTFLLGHHTNVN